jgi:hypothetical protein
LKILVEGRVQKLVAPVIVTLAIAGLLTISFGYVFYGTLDTPYSDDGRCDVCGVSATYRLYSNDDVVKGEYCYVHAVERYWAGVAAGKLLKGPSEITSVLPICCVLTSVLLSGLVVYFLLRRERMRTRGKNPV